MDKQKLLFLQILSDYLSERDTVITDETDWSMITQLAKNHQVEGIIYRQCRKILPEEVKSKLEVAYAATVFSFIKRKKALQEITDEFHSQHISFFEVKGFQVAQYYPVPELRTMGDCDLIIHRKEMPKAMAVMRSMGYSGVDNDRAHDWECVRNGFLFELHDWLVQDVEHTKADQEHFFNAFDEYVQKERLDPSFHFLFLLMHLRKHFMNTGIGIRQFMDLAVVGYNESGLRWEWIKQKLKDLRLERFFQSCASLIFNWFGISLPIEMNSLDDDFIEIVTENVLRNGVFGFQNNYNRGNYERNLIIKAGKFTVFNRFMLVFRKAFPPYQYMCIYPGIEYVADKPYLLPISWIHRLILYGLKKDRTTAKRVIRESLADQTRLDEQKKYLERMGLLN